MLSIEKKVAFIPNAKDSYADKSGLDRQRDFFLEKGFKVKDVDLNKFKDDKLYKELSKYKIIYVAGGNCFVLLQKMSESDFDKILPKLLKKGIIYVGASAGGCVMGSSIEPLGLLDQPEYAQLDDFNGLGYIDFVFVPHVGHPKYDKGIKELYKKYSKKFKLQKFTDTEGIIVEDGVVTKI
jgi:dipeptidase E